MFGKVIDVISYMQLSVSDKKIIKKINKSFRQWGLAMKLYSCKAMFFVCRYIVLWKLNIGESSLLTHVW